MAKIDFGKLGRDAAPWPILLRARLPDIDKISIMADPVRVTEPLLDVLEVLVQALRDDTEPHGWAIMKSTGRTGPTVYGVLDRLEDAGWITGRTEDRNPHSGRPPRRFYRLTPNGTARTEQILAVRRPSSPDRALRGSPRPTFLTLLRAMGLGAAR